MFITVDDVLNEKKHEAIFGKPEIIVWKDEVEEMEVLHEERKLDMDGWMVRLLEYLNE